MELKRKNKLLYILGAILIVLCAVITPFMFNKHNGVYARGTDGNYYYTDFFNGIILKNIGRCDIMKPLNC